MQAQNALLKFIGKAALNAVGGGVLGDFAIDVIPEIAKDVWQWWGKKRTPQERQAEVQALAQTPPEELADVVVEIVEEVAADKPPEVQKALATYLGQVPAAIRRSLRRPADPSGRTVPPERTVQKADDLMPFLPSRMPRFKPGDRPANMDYELVELLGVGGFGEVWKARNPAMDSLPPVALKFCLDQTARDQILRHEATVLNQVMRDGQHPGIVPLRATYLRSETPCLAYEYVPGGDLTSVILQLHRQAKKTPEVIIEQATTLLEKLADIVAFAHRLRPPIVHRDLKPANILVQRTSDGGLKLRIADFGIGGVVAGQNIQQTRGTGQGQYQHSVVRGAYTPLYASPQQMKGESPDPRDDVHALGVIWYQMLTGDLGKGCPGGSAWAKKLKEQGMEKGLIELLTACFEEDPDDRPADAGKLVDRLREVGRSKPKKPKTIVSLEETEAKVFERYAAAKTIYEEAKDEMEKQKEAATDLLWRKMIQLWHQQRTKPENPHIHVPSGAAKGQVQIKEMMKLEVPEGLSLVYVLQAAGLSRECVDQITKTEVVEETDVSLRSITELAKANPDLATKIQKLLEQGLTPAEQEQAFEKTVSSKIKKGFLERVADYAGSEEELQRLFEVIKPQFNLTAVTYRGDLERVFSEIHGRKDRVALEDAETV